MFRFSLDKRTFPPIFPELRFVSHTYKSGRLARKLAVNSNSSLALRKNEIGAEMFKNCFYFGVELLFQLLSASLMIPRGIETWGVVVHVSRRKLDDARAISR